MKAKYLPNTIQKELNNLSEELYEHKLRDIEARLNEHLQKYIGRDVIFEIDEGFSDPWYIRYYGKNMSIYAKFDLYNGISIYTEIESYRLFRLNDERIDKLRGYVSKILSDAEIQVGFLKYKQGNTLYIKKREFNKFKKQLVKSGIEPFKLKIEIFPSLRLHKEPDKRTKELYYPGGLGIVENLYVIEP